MKVVIAMEGKVRVLVAGMPRMAAEIITALLDANPDIEVVSDPDSAPLAERAEETGADVVIVGLSQPVLPTECRRLLERRPDTRILAVVGDGGLGSLYELRVHEVGLGELSRDQLLSVIRSTRRTNDEVPR